MRFLLLIIFIHFFSVSAISQEHIATFPDDFFGIYSGNLHISSEKGDQTIPMEFHLFTTDSVHKYKYTLVYGDGETKQIRSYNLVEKNKEKGTYVIDENNGIILDCKVLDNKMYTLFEVNGNLLTTFITFEADHLIFEIIFASRDDKNVSYAENEDKNEVGSFPISTIQKAMLKKQ